MRVGCLSECNDSILMWSHYADNHRGICIEYDLTNSIHQKLYPVIYTHLPIDCSNLEDPDLAWLVSILDKYDIWKYEKEWRIVFDAPREQVRVDFPGIPKPKAIYLGAHFLQNWVSVDKRKPEEYVALFGFFTRLYEFIMGNQIPLYFMRNHQSSYEVFPVAIDVNSVFLNIYEFLRKHAQKRKG